MVDVKKNAGNLSLEGGKLCLDFTNTVDWRNDKSLKITIFQSLIASW